MNPFFDSFIATIGDGSVNAAPWINDALDRLSYTYGGGVLTLPTPPVAYRCDDALVLQDATRLNMDRVNQQKEPQDRCIVSYAPDAAVKVAAGADSAGFERVKINVMTDGAVGVLDRAGKRIDSDTLVIHLYGEDQTGLLIEANNDGFTSGAFYSEYKNVTVAGKYGNANNIGIQLKGATANGQVNVARLGSVDCNTLETGAIIENCDCNVLDQFTAELIDGVGIHVKGTSQSNRIRAAYFEGFGITDADCDPTTRDNTVDVVNSNPGGMGGQRRIAFEGERNILVRDGRRIITDPQIVQYAPNKNGDFVRFQDSSGNIVAWLDQNGDWKTI